MDTHSYIYIRSSSRYYYSQATVTLTAGVQLHSEPAHQSILGAESDHDKVKDIIKKTSVVAPIKLINISPTSNTSDVTNAIGTQKEKSELKVCIIISMALEYQ